jgi:type I restriction enzyme S subunit
MKSNYDVLGKYIQPIDERNTNSQATLLLGVSINKSFMPSVANTIGTDLSNYKVIRQNQFACSLMQVSRDEKIPIDRLADYEIAIVSPAYHVFEVVNTKRLLPEYLAMWFKRSEFDREASFIGVGGVRGSMTWDDFCGMKLPVPDIAVQKSIVRAYNTVEGRIKLLREINDNLETTSGVIYHRHFENTESLTVPISDLVDVRDGTHESPEPLDNGYPLVTSMHLLPYGVDFLSAYFISKEDFEKINERSKVDSLDILYSMIGTVGTVSLVIEEKIGFAIKNVALFKTSKCKELVYYILCFLKHGNTTQHINQRLAGSTQKFISLGELRSLPVISPQSIELSTFNNFVVPLFQNITTNSLEIRHLQVMSGVLLANLAH